MISKRQWQEGANYIPVEFCNSHYRSAGFRGGWMILSGAKLKAKSYIEGILLLASLRLCANVPTQYAIQTALGGHQSIKELVTADGRLHKQMNLVYERLISIPGISCVKPKGSLYVFPKIDLKTFGLQNDERFVYDLLCEQKVLVVPGTGFNYITDDHFRIVFLPTVDELNQALDKLEYFLQTRRILSTQPAGYILD